jgi:FKBP-type peptidyl-prolyl cis-trans isomerase (trigger factor)
MKDIIKLIVEIDSEARKLTDKAASLKISANEDIEREKQTMHDDMIKRVGRRIDIVRAQEQSQADEKIAAIRQAQEERMHTLETVYAQHGKEWTDQLVSRVIEGDPS